MGGKVDLYEPEPCVVVTSESSDVADTWTMEHMSRRLSLIRDCRSCHLDLYGKPRTATALIESLLYDPPNHELIGIGSPCIRR